MMFETRQHEMQLKTTHPSGAEEWYCPACGRRFLLQWPPEYKKIVLVEGDIDAAHIGGKGGVHVSAARATNEDNSDGPGQDPWSEWLDDIEFDDLSGESLSE